MNTVTAAGNIIKTWEKTGTRTTVAHGGIPNDTVTIRGQAPPPPFYGFPFFPAAAQQPAPAPAAAASSGAGSDLYRTAEKDALILGMTTADHELTSREKEAVLDTLSLYSVNALTFMKNAGLAISVVSNEEGNGSIVDRFKKASAWYFPGARKLVMRRAYLEEESWTKLRQVVKNLGSVVLGETPWGDNRSTLIHEMGHAVDDIVLKDGALSSENPVIRNMYENYKAKGKRWSFYAKSKDDVAEYVAEGHRMFGQSSRSHNELKAADPEFYGWLQARTTMLYDARYHQYLMDGR